MVRYKVIGFDCGFKDNAYISEYPFAGCLSVTKGLSKAKKFYKEEMKYVEKCIVDRSCTFEIEGEVEAKPREKVNA